MASQNSIADPVASPRRILVLGATSSIAHAYMLIRAREGAHLYLVGRDPDKLHRVGFVMKGIGSDVVESANVDLSDVGVIDGVVDDMLEKMGGIDEVFLAYGVYVAEPASLVEVARTATTNFTSAAAWLQRVAQEMELVGTGQLVVLGSITGDRARQKNYTYAASKAGLERVCQGLAHRFQSSAVSVTFAKLGWVRSEMSGDRDTSSRLYSDPDDVARIVARLVDARRNAVYVPWFWRPISTAVRLMPMWMLRRLEL